VKIPLIPHDADDAVALWHLFVGELEEKVRVDGAAIRLLAAECVAHASQLLHVHPPGARLLVLAGPDALGLSRLGSACAEAMELPHALVPITALAENGWYGRGLDKWLESLQTDGDRGSVWARRGVVTLSGLEVLRVQGGRYQASSDSTRDYRQGKAENVASLLRGEPTTYVAGDGAWDAQRALVILTTAYELADQDADALEGWGLTRELAQILAAATWIRVPAASGRIIEAQVRDFLAALEQQYSLFGVALSVAPEAVRMACRIAMERGETAAMAASWIAAPARRRLIRLLEEDARPPSIVLGPDDADIPRPSRGTWID
jgi:hypothetical protein